jgi:23S rRNA (uracil1939-C5)-methyltransferase
MNRRKAPRRDNRRGPQTTAEHELEIVKLGSEGVGIAYLNDKPILIPGALPGETIRAVVTSGSREARLLQVVRASPERVEPRCRHVSRCGGCALQHLDPSSYGRFKRNLIEDALRRQGLGAVEIGEIAFSPPQSRRRATLEAHHMGARVTLGFHGRAAHTLVEVTECPVLEPALVAVIGPVRKFLADLLKAGERATLSLVLLDHGVDIGLSLPREPDLAGLEALAEFAKEQDLCRLWWRAGGLPPVPAAIRRAPVITLGGVATTAPMGGFLQATRAGEQALVGQVLSALQGRKAVADLFAGSGTFSLPLVMSGKTVHAVEADPEAIGALSAAGRGGQLTGLTTERRDLEARPLLEAELQRFDAVVFDPPRAGARAQAEILARAAVDTIVAVSCNPATYARDAAILVAGGWRHERITPVDQFLWAAHIELVGVFRRAG